MIWSSFALSLYFSRKSFAPEKAIWLMYSSTSSAVMPMPLSSKRMVFRSGLTRTRMPYSSPSGRVNSPMRESFFSFVTASQPLEIISRRKMSWSE